MLVPLIMQNFSPLKRRLSVEGRGDHADQMSTPGATMVGFSTSATEASVCDGTTVVSTERYTSGPRDENGAIVGGRPVYTAVIPPPILPFAAPFAVLK